MSWKPEIDELKRRSALAREMGGREKVERQHYFGKLPDWVRRRPRRHPARSAGSARHQLD